MTALTEALQIRCKDPDTIISFKEYAARHPTYEDALRALLSQAPRRNPGPMVMAGK